MARILPPTATEDLIKAYYAADCLEVVRLRDSSAERNLFGYPPYSRVIVVIIKDYNQAIVDLLSRELAEAIRGALGVRLSFAPGVQNGPNVIGPYSPAIDKISNQNIRQIRVLLPKDRSLVRNKETLAAVVERFEKDKKYSGHIALDVDPV